MKANGILLDNKDNVATTTEAIKQGEHVRYFIDDSIYSISAKQQIPSYHKIAIKDIEKGEIVIKYGEIIGAAIVAIKKGEYVSHLNIKSLPRDYNKEIKER